MAILFSLVSNISSFWFICSGPSSNLSKRPGFGIVSSTSFLRCKFCLVSLYLWGIISVASPICQEGKSERTFPILAFSSRFSSFFSIFPLFPDFWQFFRCQGGTLPPCPYTGYALLLHLSKSWCCCFNDQHLIRKSNSWCKIWQSCIIKCPTCHTDTQN